MTPAFPEFTPKQLEGVRVLGEKRFVLLGGACGGGKSFWLRWVAVHFLISLFKNHNVKSAIVGLFCEDYPSLEDRQIKKIRAEFPEWLGKWNGASREFKLLDCWGGGIISCRNLDDPSKYASSEFCGICIDELTRNPRSVFDNLLHRMRWPGVPIPKFMAASNPVGTGVQWVKKLWVDRNFIGEPPMLKDEMFGYVPAKATDNPYLPPSYFTETLASLPEAMRHALMDGSWDVIEGMYFQNWSEKIHVCKPWEFQEGVTDRWGIPHSWRRIGGVDWGRAAPWAALEAAIEPDTGRLVFYRGVAEPGWEHDRQAKWMLDGAPGVVWYVDAACRHRGAANAKELRAQDLSHIELWQKSIDGKLSIMPVDNRNKAAAWQEVSRLLDPLKEYPDRAGMVFFDVPGMRGEHGIITTLPKLIHDKYDPEQVDDTGDDHAGMALAYLCRGRPQKVKVPPAPMEKFGEQFGKDDYRPEIHSIAGKSKFHDW